MKANTARFRLETDKIFESINETLASIPKFTRAKSTKAKKSKNDEPNWLKPSKGWR